MRTKKDIQFLLENGLSSSFLSKLNDSQTKSLVERFNKKETNEITMVSSADSATQSKLQSEKKPYEVYEKTEMDEDTKTAPAKPKVNPGTKPTHPFKPAPDKKGAPKAIKKELPSFLTFNALGLNK